VKDKVAWKRKRGRESEGKKGRKKKAGRHLARGILFWIETAH
jgi:hypothetical protein